MSTDFEDRRPKRAWVCSLLAQRRPQPTSAVVSSIFNQQHENTRAFKITKFRSCTVCWQTFPVSPSSRRPIDILYERAPLQFRGSLTIIIILFIIINNYLDSQMPPRMQIERGTKAAQNNCYVFLNGLPHSEWNA